MSKVKTFFAVYITIGLLAATVLAVANWPVKTADDVRFLFESAVCWPAIVATILTLAIPRRDT